MVQSASGRQRYRIAVAKIQEDAGVRVGRPGEPVELALVYLELASQELGELIEPGPSRRVSFPAPASARSRKWSRSKPAPS